LETRNVRLLVTLLIAAGGGAMASNGVFASVPLSFAGLGKLLPLGLRGTALVAFGLTLSVLVLLTLVSEGGFRKGELSTAVPSFFAFYAFFFGMTYWLFA
jgi:hypothetical protein